MDNLHQANDASGAWQTEAPGPHTRRYTAYIKYVVGEPGGEDTFIEEIDVNATSQGYARNIAEAVMEEHYEPGGTIAEVREQIGWYM